MAKKTATTLPDDFLTTPAKDITVTRIDFNASNLSMYKDRYAVVVDHALTPSECETLIGAAEAGAPDGWERAMINIGAGRQALYEDQRSCGRIIWDSQELATKIWKRIEKVPEIQEILSLSKRPLITGNMPAMRGDVWVFSRPNERMRFLKYTGGEYFRPHCDGIYETPDKKERSWFTMHLYLNGDEPAHSKDHEQHSKLIGGATIFHAYSFKEGAELSVHPKPGRILVFQHRDLVHSGDDVIQGVKYTVRTDLMYALESTKAPMPLD